MAALGVALTAFALIVVTTTGLPKAEIRWMHPPTILGTVAYYARVIFGGRSPPPVPCLDTSSVMVALGGAVLALYGVAIAACVRFDRRLASFGLVVAALGIAPYLNAIPTPTLLSGRWVLVLLLGTVIAAVDLARGRAGIAVLAVATTLCAFGSFRAQEPWSSRRALWTDNVERNDCSSEPYSNLATAYSLDQRWPEAEAVLVRGIAVEPRNGKLYRDWALLVMLTGGCRPALAPREAKRLYDAMETGAFTAADARARGLWDVARILALRRAFATREAPAIDASRVIGGRVCSRTRLDYVRAVLAAGRE